MVFCKVRILFALCLIPSLALGANTATEQPVQNLHIEQAWVRAMPPGHPNSVAYMKLTNRGNTAITLMGASTDAARAAELHISREVDGYMSMSALEQVNIAAGETVQLVPGGMHLMLFGITPGLTAGDTLSICLKLAGGAVSCTEASVKK